MSLSASSITEFIENVSLLSVRTLNILVDTPPNLKEIIQTIMEGSSVIAAVAGVIGTLLAFSKNFREWANKKLLDAKTRRDAKKNMPMLVAQIYENVKTLDTRVIKVEREVSPNGGGSMKDQLKLIKAELDATNWLTPRPTFRTTSTGMNLYVNEAYCQLCSCSPEELLKLGWKTFVSDEEQADEFYNRWILTAKALSQFASKLKIQNKHGEYRGEWMIRLRPLGPIEKENSEDDYLWNGSLYPSDEVAKTYAKTFGIHVF